MKAKYQNNQCPVCGEQFNDLIGQHEFTCPECYTTLKVKYFELYDQQVGVYANGFYIDPDDYRPILNTILKPI